LTYVFGARYQWRGEANNQGVDIRISGDQFNGALVLFGGSLRRSCPPGYRHRLRAPGMIAGFRDWLR
jgi:hypothetical protein